MLSLECVLKWLGGTDRLACVSEYQAAIEQALVQQDLARDPIWTEGIAVGGRTFIEKATGKVRNRVRISDGCISKSHPISGCAGGHRLAPTREFFPMCFGGFNRIDRILILVPFLKVAAPPRPDVKKGLSLGDVGA